MSTNYRPPFSRKPAETLPDIKPAPRGDAAKMSDLVTVSEAAVADILRKQGVRAVVNVQATGKRIIIAVTDLSEELVYLVARAIAEAVERLKASVFINRYDVHHTIYVNNKKLAFSQ